MSAEFLTTALVVALVPGTGVVYTVSTGLFSGRRASLFAALGCTVGIVPHVAAAILGLSAVMNTGAHVFQALRVVGVAYLFYLAWATWRSRGGMAFEPTGVRRPRAVVARGALLNLLNPKLTIFFFALLPPFLRPGSPDTPQLVWLGAVFMAVTLVVFAGYGALAGTVRDRVVGSPRVVDRLRQGFAGVFAVLGLRLALEER